MPSLPSRTFVMQILRLIVWVVIAVALVKIAFFPTQKAEETLGVQGTFTLPTTTVQKGDIENNISLTGTVVRDEIKPAKATESGEIVWLYAEDGDTVGVDAPILQVRKTTEPDLSQPLAEGQAPPAPEVTYHDVYATSAGTLRLNALMGQSVQIGEEIGSIVPNTFHLEVPVTPDKLYSLTGLPDTATIAITDGPAPFECTGLKTVTATSGSASSEAGQHSNTGPQIRCQIPTDQTVYDGTKGKLRISGGSASDVLVIPVSAVEGRFREGYVYLPTADPKTKPEKVLVKLGISDGKMIEVKEGLSLDQEILEFVPRGSNEDDTDENSDGGTEK
ncbi:MAG: efflux RND transporter periplasmic adaptor subunit [Actinomycetaceae bacterium]|nr:efflux RND transporter periplasmic adaptor subunit [Actinomycetaceae bacterium]